MDLTSKGVQRQLAAMGCPGYELGVKDVSTGKMLSKSSEVWSATQVLQAVPRLKRQNSQGAQIYIRPAGVSGLVLLDDITITTLQTMTDDGFEPLCALETSPLNYQAWVRVWDSKCAQDLTPDYVTAVARVLAKRYRGDLNSADWRHFGRLAGFTNRKPCHLQEDGRYPFVLLRQSRQGGGVAPGAGSVLKEAAEALEAWKEEQRRKATLSADRQGSKSSADPCLFYQSEFRKLAADWGTELNLSIADWRIAGAMEKAGYSRDEIRGAIYQESPRLLDRKKGHVEHYVELTLDNRLGTKDEA